MNTTNIDFSKLEFNEIGAWPLPARILVLLGIAVLAILASYFLFVNEKVMDLHDKHSVGLALRDEFRDKFHKAASLEVYKRQMEEMKDTLHVLLRQLPAEGKVPSLMEDISLQAMVAGLEFSLIKPGTEVVKEFYTELPIKMYITGSYHGFGKFISGIAMLPRIVTLHDFEIKINQANPKDSNKRQTKPLAMELNAKTYWCPNRENL